MEKAYFIFLLISFYLLRRNLSKLGLNHDSYDDIFFYKPYADIFGMTIFTLSHLKSLACLTDAYRFMSLF